ncbi:hypothetical protein [Petroclostridium sp. X23]|uniref:hypothetical protein n=1 Tax=Petroclostridium sp. X23 TaxID=3045146 RepID=UPI0024AD13E4|nr:hypothetical protein [Petroclostridium sp. X23]WHH61564.1 hypothetical protein QKW49_13050 [Petroclostridium sp. X23]
MSMVASSIVMTKYIVRSISKNEMQKEVEKILSYSSIDQARKHIEHIYEKISK